MVIPENYVNLVSRLISLTGEKKVSWEKASLISTSRFGATIGLSTVDLDFDADSFELEVHLSIHNERGEEVDSFEVSQDEPGYGDIKGLWDAARRVALKVDQTIAGLERELEQLGGSGGDPL